MQTVSINKAELPFEDLRNFLVGSVQKAVLIIGVIVGLSALEVPIGPLLGEIRVAGLH